MSFKLNTSKYRHSVGKSSKKEEWYSDLSIGVSPSDSSNSLSASTKWLAYKHGNGSGSGIGILDIKAPGKLGKPAPVLHGHSAAVVDLEFSTLDDDLLASCAEDSRICIWRVHQSDVSNSEPIASFSSFQKRVENVHFNPGANNILAASSNVDLRLFDLEKAVESLSLASHPDLVQSFSWSGDGTRVVSSCRDGLVRIWDPRANQQASVVSGNGHAGNKSSRVTWLGDKEMIFTTGFNATRQREYCLFDVKNMSQPLLRTQMESSSTLLLPTFDEDSSIVYMVGKGDTTVKWLDISDTAPYGTVGTPLVVNSPISGLCLLPKRALNVMEGEVARVLAICGDSIAPLSFIVPRKSYRDFHEDLFPPTKCGKSNLSSERWLKGENERVATFSLDPTKAMGNLTIGTAVKEAKDTVSSLPSPVQQGNASQVESRRSSSNSVMANFRSSAFRYIAGKPQHPREHFDDIRGLFYGLTGESNVLEANDKFLAFPLSGAGGRIGIVCTNSPGRFPAVIPSLVAGSDVTDFAISKMRQDLLVTASEDGKLRGWKIPENGLKEDISNFAFSLSGHLNRVNMVQFHPFVDSVVLSTSVEQQATGGQMPTVRLWDVETQKDMVRIEGFKDLVLGAAFSMDGKGLLATSCRDKLLRISDARSAETAFTTTGHENVRGCRVVWAKEYLLTTGFGRGSQREVSLWDPRNFNSALYTLNLDVSPSILVPHYDEDTKLVYLCGRGDTGILPIEVDPSTGQALFPVARFDAPGATIQQGCVFLPKRKLDFKSIEVARCWRLTQTSIEPVSFTLPRNRKEYFQDDLYPLCRDMEKPTMTASSWFNGAKETVPGLFVDLCPDDMKKLSEAPVQEKAPPKYSLDKSGKRKLTDNERQDKFMDEIFQNAQEDATDGPLKQDQMEGVDSDEWDD